ncbi:prophage CP4-57 integrase IntA domain protein [Burkholderia cepacia]|nr:prophage CP4-57 integrase IntA domain protein [Burkholderia cepacia]
MRHLPLYNVPSEAKFTQSRSRQPAKPVPRHSRLVAHAI